MSRFSAIIVLLGFLFCRVVLAAAEDVVWVSELEDNAALVGKEIIVEGRYQGRVGANVDQIRLKNCNVDKIEFRLGPEVDRRFPSKLKFIRLTGTLTKSGGRLVVHVKSWTRIATTDENRFRDLAGRIDATDHRAWYKLAEKTQRLAEFYDEKELRGLAEEARVKGFRAEEAGLRPAQVDELLALAGRAADVGLGEDESRRMRHKAMRYRCDDLKERRAAAAQWSELADKVSKLLPGAKSPLKPADLSVVNQYNVKPLNVYESTARARDACDRSLWLEATTQSLLAAAEQPNADVARLATDAKRLVPERPEVARQLLKKWAEAESTRVPTLPPASQIRKLADTFRSELAEPDRAEAVLRLWLDTRRGKLSPRDADGRVLLAKDFHSDLKDDATAGKLLLEAIQIEADLPEALEQLKLLGYQKGPIGWVRGGDSARSTKEGQGNSAQRRLPQKNMTPDQVRTILGEPKPEDKVRLAAGSKNGQRILLEQWTYRGPPDLYITFQILSLTESRVIAINTQAQK